MSSKVTNKIRLLRVKKKLTQEDLASSIGVTRQTIIAMEKGNYIPSVLLALKISEFFKKPVESIFKVQL